MSERLPVGFYFNRTVPVAAIDLRANLLVDPVRSYEITTYIDVDGEDCAPEDATIIVVHFKEGWGNVQIKPFKWESVH